MTGFGVGGWLTLFGADFLGCMLLGGTVQHSAVNLLL